MAKTKTAYFCQNCGANSPKWVGKCPACGEWNTYVEEVVSKSTGTLEKEVWQDETKVRDKPTRIQELTFDDQRRIKTNSGELDRTLGGGIAYRKNTFDATAITPIGTVVPLDPRHDSSVVFTYNFSMGLEYMFSQNYSARLGYRLLGLTSNESFDGSFQHLIELGVGANF